MLCHMACRISVPQPGTEPRPLQWKPGILMLGQQRTPLTNLLRINGSYIRKGKGWRVNRIFQTEETVCRKARNWKNMVIWGSVGSSMWLTSTGRRKDAGGAAWEECMWHLQNFPALIQKYFANRQRGRYHDSTNGKDNDEVHSKGRSTSKLG